MVRTYPPLRPYAACDVWAMTAAEAEAFDAWAIREVGIPQPVLMENAGRATASVTRLTRPDGPVVGLVGGGNNGGDTLVALRTLASWGRPARAVLVSDRAPDDPLLHGWPVDATTDGELGAEGVERALTGAGVVLDGILGTGARGAPRERQAAVIEALGRAGRPVVALDVPSGVDASTGGVPGAAVSAEVTVSFGVAKLGTLLHPARARVGRLLVAEIGFPPVPADAAGCRVTTPAWARSRLPVRGTDTHKNAVGRVLVVAGRTGMGGAAVLAATGAFRAGAGLVRVASVEANRGALHAALPEAIFIDQADPDALGAAAEASDAIAVGPGLGTDAAAAEALRAVLDAAPRATVLDADALNLSASGTVDLAAVAAARPLLVTPHPGEMRRLIDDEGANGPVATAGAAAARFGCAVLLKGAPSVVAEPGRPARIDTQSSSDLAVAGMGDVLTGVCAALAAAGLEPASAGAVALYLAGRAARIAGRGPGLMPSDVLRWLPEAMTEPSAPVGDPALPYVSFDADPAA